MKVLIVDDSATVIVWLKAVIVSAGLEVVPASSGEEALERLADQDISLVMTDLQMPGIDGMQLLREIRRKFTHLPVVVMSGVGEVEDAVELLRLGADEFLAKPIRQDELLSCLERLRAKARIYEEARLFASMMHTAGGRPPMERLGELLSHFAQAHRSPARAFSLEALELLEKWRGPEAEFTALVERAIRLAQGPVVERADLVQAAQELKGEAATEAAPAHATEAAEVAPAAQIPRFEAAMRLVVDRFERLYLEKLLAAAPSLEEAAQLAGLDPARLQELLRRHQLVELPSTGEGFLVAP